QDRGRRPRRLRGRAPPAPRLPHASQRGAHAPHRERLARHADEDGRDRDRQPHRGARRPHPSQSREQGTRMSAKAAFLGLGGMGSPMAGHLKAKGYDVVVYNRSAEKAKAWVEKHGGRSASTPAEAAKDCDFVMMCVGNDKDLLEVALGAQGALAGMKK